MATVATTTSHPLNTIMNDTEEGEEEGGLPPFMHFGGGSHSSPFDGSSDQEGDDGMGIPWWYTVLLIVGFFAIILVSVLLRELFYRCYGIKLCSRPLLHGNGNEYQQQQQQRQRQLQRDRSSNINITNPQGLTAEELREQQVEQQRMERKLWYQYFLKPYVTVLTAQNFALSTSNYGDSKKEVPPEKKARHNQEVDLAQIAAALSVQHYWDSNGGQQLDEDDEENQIQVVGMQLDTEEDDGADDAAVEPFGITAVTVDATANNNNIEDGATVSPLQTMPTIEENQLHLGTEYHEETAAAPCEFLSRDFVALQDQLVSETEGETLGPFDDQLPVDGDEELAVTVDIEAQAPVINVNGNPLPPEEEPPVTPNRSSIRPGHHRRVSSIPCPLMEIWDPHENNYRRLEANCSICLNDYEVGDSIVQSAAGTEEEICKHVYHYDCMLLWLSQGKKRCPMCRHWFVPALRIKDQMKLAHITQSTSHHHLLDADNNNRQLLLVSSSSVADTESNTTHSRDNSTSDGSSGGGNGNNTSSGGEDEDTHNGNRNISAAVVQQMEENLA